MNLLAIIAQFYLPTFIKKKRLQELFELTANGFQSDMPGIKGISYNECLNMYAKFSKAKAEEVIELPSKAEEVKKRLYQNAYQMGEKLRRDFRVKTQSDVIRLSKILYKILKIEFTRKASGKIIIKCCFFSKFYSPEICGIISSLDEGVAAGLSAGGRLVFEKRITEGNDCCQATFCMKDVTY
ncbi:MAG: L-2-amino-thiazoline-4-carboxylic acid hydrolase [bacterium]|nr:L-2-amino-thiazoline-4-carboxylic acid hydrolase [bacterium]